MPIEAGTINFNPELMKQNKVKSVEIKVVNKQDGAFIVDQGTTYGYKFDTDGYVTRYYYTVFKKVEAAETPTNTALFSGKNSKKGSPPSLYKFINDTIFTEIKYDSQHHITCKRVQNGATFDSYYYTYDNSNQVIKEVHYKETNAGKSMDDYKPGSQELIYTETYDYKILSPNQTKKITMNGRGAPFKNTFIKYDNKKNLIAQTHESTVSSTRQEYTYAYNPANKLIKKSFKSNENGSIPNESVYEYSKGGNLISEKKYKNNVLVYELNFIYDENGLFIRSEANRNHTTATVFIARYNYEYYP